MNLINCTPHPIVFVQGDGNKTIFPPSGVVPRVSVNSIPIEPSPLPYPVVREVMGKVENLPEFRADQVLIVSRLVFEASPDRQDLIAPDTGAGAVRDGNNRIVGVTRFVIR